MPLNGVEREIAKAVVHEFVTQHRPTTRRSLLRQFKGGLPEALTRLVNLTVLKTVPNASDLYLPWSLAFHLCGDAELLRFGRTSLEVILHSLRALYDQDLERDRKPEHTPADIVAEAHPITPEMVSVGLHLAEELGIFSMMRWNTGHTEIASFQIGERILAIGDINNAWDNHIKQWGARLEQDRAPNPDGPAAALQSEEVSSPNRQIDREGFSETAAKVENAAAAEAATIPPPAQPPVYISYAPQDLAWMTRVAMYLAEAGYYVPDPPHADSSVRSEIAAEQLRRQSRVFILLVSFHYLESEEIHKTEFPDIRSLVQGDSRRIIYVILDQCPWSSRLALGLPATVIPVGGSALSEKNEEQVKDELHMLARAVRSAIQETDKAPHSEMARPTTATDAKLVPISRMQGFSFSHTSENVLDFAKRIASKRKPPPQPLSSSALLFGMVEIGRQSQRTRTAAHFLYKWISSKDETAYRTAYEGYLDEGGTTSQDRSVRMTENLLGLLQCAADIVHETSKSADIHARHLLGALLVFKPGRPRLRPRRRLSSMGFDLLLLRKDFLQYLENARDDDHGAWERILSVKEDVSITSEPSDEGQLGPSTHVARDRWTTEDSLGHFPYAYAIYRFLTDDKTEPPLAISIQAPWGGGKSSLMRMIQSQLDPDAVRQLEKANSQSDSRPASAKVKDVLLELERSSPDGNAKNRQQDDKTRFAVPTIEGGDRRRVTIWFNAWKYDSTSQVWAGLADSIVQQIGERLGPVDRELFWFRLQLRRLDISKIRRRVYEQVFSKFLERVVPRLLAYVGVAGASLVGAIAAQNAQHPWYGWSGFVATLFAEFFAARRQFGEAKSDVEEKEAKTSLGDIVQAPDYRANLGFVHEVVEDLKRVFEIIPTKHLPMVIFIDDLDRCSPGKVAEVVEAINLFLAGEFPHCMFILGIDDEMVAAALDKAHGDVIAKLPGYAKSTSIGWRFMDKFVQLPFIIPPSTTTEIERYTESLLSLDGERADIRIETRDRAAQVVEQNKNEPSAPEKVVEQVAAREPLTATQRQTLKKDIEVIQKMSRNISQFSDKEKNIRELIVSGAKGYSTNPRDLKRFVNLFRFYYFLRAAREGRKEQVPSLEQMCRWIVLSLRWPEVVRWLRHPSKQGSVANSPLAALEDLGAASKDIAAWQKGAEGQLGLKIGEATWLTDESLLKFFQKEATSYRKQERLSTCAGMGLW